jgi:Xaa-Pro aminopeptidase
MADARLVAYLAGAGGDALVTADPGLVRMLTGHACDLETGPSPFALGPVVVAPAVGEPVLVCSADEAPEGAESYEGFTIGPLDPVAGAVAALRRARDRVGSSSFVLDTATVPAALAPALPHARPAGADLRQLGAIKTPGEVAAIEAALRLCDAGQAAARSASVAGATELEVWAATRAAIEAAAGGRVALLADLVAGPRTGEVGGPPTDRPLAAGDLVLCDLVPRLDGVWGDSCATWAVGAPTARARALHEAAMAGLEAALAALRPGALAADVDATARAAVGEAGFSYPHHTGHGLGFRYHEEPRIVPDGPAALVPGMVVALEPGAYEEALGVRVEVVAVVTEAGHRVLSGHSLGLDGGMREHA